jgi:hypothetical protein
MTRTVGKPQNPAYVDSLKKETLNFNALDYVNEVFPGDQFGYKIIMTVDKHGNWWWVTKGLTCWDDAYVRDYGDKISEEAADELFPQMKHLGYRYRN